MSNLKTAPLQGQADKNNIEAIYPLSPMQEGMLFHTLYAPASEVYFVQLDCTLHGQLNIPAFRQAWQRVIDRHSALRTLFMWERRDKPFQVVRWQVRLPWEQHDWQKLPPGEQREHLESFLQADRARGFDLAQAPLMRVTLIQIAEETYQFIWSFHHSLLDGWSVSLVLREVFAFYEAFCRGQNLHLDHSRPYRDYVAWLQQQDLSRAEVFWRRVLQGFAAPTPLGVDRARIGELETHPAEEYGEQRLRLSPTTTVALQSLARQHRLTLNTLVQGTWALILSRYSGEEDVVFGATVSGRPTDLAGVESMVGLFINTLPARVRVSPRALLLSWLKELQAQQVKVRQYEYSPLVEIQGWSDVPRSQPLFESILVFENYPASAVLQPEGHSSSTLPSSEVAGQALAGAGRQQWRGNLEVGNLCYFERTNYPLTVMVKSGAELLLRISYNCHYFDAATIARMLGHVQTLLASIAANPDQHLSELPLLTEAERCQLLIEWNDTRTDYPRDQCIHQLFEAQVERTPDAVAVVFEDHKLTYRELSHRANQLAHYLQTLGVGQEVRVGVCMERSLEMVIGLYGILKAGGAYIPLDPTYPQERLAYMLKDAQVPVLLTQGRLATTLPEHRAHVICLDNDWEAIAQKSTENPVSRVTGENLAYVIYTSGSTGRSKGTMNTHRGIRNRLLWMQDAYQLTKVDRVLQKTPFSFDVSVWEFFWPLLTGARLIVARPEGHKDSAYLVRLIAEQQITTIHFVPSMLQVFLEEQNLESCDCLRRVICSGEALPFELQERFFASFAERVELHNLYGPTEAAVDVTYWACRREREWQSVPMGRPIANIQIYLLDSHLQPVPVGVPGELHIGGIGLARGYLNRPDLTAEKFIPNPFSDEPGVRLYKTGDLARYLPDGNIEYLGRLDHQVKIRGFRIELGEIEAFLGQHPAVREAAAMAREDVPGQKRLVAYVVPYQEQTLIISELRSFLQAKLPDYMLPSALVLLKAMPLTPNGKIDRRALPAPDTARPELEETYVAPRTQAETLLANIWANLLGVEQVGIHDNFFELGGDSILSIQITARANQTGLRLTPQQLFQHPTIAELAAVAGTTPAIAAEEGPVTGPVPLTPIQHWFFEQALPDSHHWNQAMLLEARQPLAPALLEQVVQHLLDHHDAFRLRFVRAGSASTSIWQQFNAGPGKTVPFSRVDLSALPMAVQGKAIAKAVAELQASLNLSEGPLLRVVFFNLSPQQSDRLLIVIHHLAVDGVSWRILLEDIETTYQQLSQGEAIQLPPKTTSFKEWAERLTEYARLPALQQELDYWLAEAWTQVPCLPVDYPKGANTKASVRTVSVSLSTEETRALLQEVPAAYRTQINDVLLTALVQAFARWTGSQSLLIDLEGHGREEIVERVDLSRTVGWFTTVFPVFLHLEGISQPGEALKSIKEQLHYIPNKGIGYGLLRYLSEDPAVARKLQAQPQAEVSFNYLGQFDQALSSSSMFRLARESSGPAQSQRGSRTYLVEVNGSITEGRLQLDWTYSENIHRRATVECLAQGFLEALRSLISHCQSPEASGYTPSDFPEAGLGQQELDALLVELGELME